MTHAESPAPHNPDHHLWRNGRYWWIAFTLLYHGWRQERVRRSLRTADVHEARRRRDAILEHFARSADPVLSLRLVSVRARSRRPRPSTWQARRGAAAQSRAA